MRYFRCEMAVKNSSIEKPGRFQPRTHSAEEYFHHAIITINIKQNNFQQIKNAHLTINKNMRQDVNNEKFSNMGADALQG